ncbi:MULTISPECIES: hypothetical protein [Bifidobacterium]|uniref:Single-stranded DNA-binding protein n=1 Tax=Bifidobacterium oedipodis TaxID=2675322 RepID=A0A7Y0EQD4_9BIFI|nr:MULTISPECIES: hypothetical protein [Bifidobacterium]MBW3079036.1 hypothetical protein [Bifidobacterium simiiventris]NMM93401.1 hypothetical protein [Bifidobacterium sp. DSM 109957]
MGTKRYMIVRGELLADPVFTVSDTGGELVRLRIGVRMPNGLAEPVIAQGGSVMPAYCREQRLEQGDLIVASGWADAGNTSHDIANAEVRVNADMIAASTSMNWKEPA